MKVIVVDSNKKKKTNGKEIEYRLNLFLEWLIYMFGYAIVLLITSNLFRPLYVENFLYGFIAAVLIYILNKTVNPIPGNNKANNKFPSSPYAKIGGIVIKQYVTIIINIIFFHFKTSYL